MIASLLATFLLVSNNFLSLYLDTKEIIRNIYKDKSGFGSIQKTYKDANDKDNTITLKNVKDWFSNNVERKKAI